MSTQYSLTPIEEEKQQQKPDNSPPTPDLWFNPKTNRWISKSCRVYRELMRDRELALRGLKPGPKEKKQEKKVIEEVDYFTRYGL